MRAYEEWIKCAQTDLVGLLVLRMFELRATLLKLVDEALHVDCAPAHRYQRSKHHQ